MRRALNVIAILLLAASFLLPQTAQARYVRPVQRTPHSVLEADWLDLSAQIPTTKLDDYADTPYLSMVTSRGDQWLAGNKNQLFMVNGDKIKDLTPDLKDFGFVSLRQVAGDGQSWLVIGDSGFWNAQPDLAFVYDGVYWKNVSYLMSNLPPEEWVGHAVGKRGLWVIPTSHGVYIWDSSLTQPASVAYPAAFREPGVSDINFHAVENGWVAEFTQANGPKSKAFGSRVLDRRFFFFDGTSFKEITGAFRGLGDRSVVGSDGTKIFAFGVSRTLPKTASIQGLLSDGNSTQDLARIVRRLWDIRETRPLLVNGKAVWTGKGWLLTDENNNLAICDVAVCRMQKKTRDTVLDAGYGNAGRALLVGYARDANGMLRPRMARMQIH